MKVKAKVEAIGNSEVGNRQKGNSALYPTGYSPFPTHKLNRKLYIPPFLLEKT